MRSLFAGAYNGRRLWYKSTTRSLWTFRRPGTRFVLPGRRTTIAKLGIRHCEWPEKPWMDVDVIPSLQWNLNELKLFIAKMVQQSLNREDNRNNNNIIIVHTPLGPCMLDW